MFMLQNILCLLMLRNPNASLYFLMHVVILGHCCKITKTDGVGIFVAEKWADSVVRVERHSERIMVLKMVLGD